MAIAVALYKKSPLQKTQKGNGNPWIAITFLWAVFKQKQHKSFWS